MWGGAILPTHCRGDLMKQCILPILFLILMTGCSPPPASTAQVTNTPVPTIPLTDTSVPPTITPEATTTFTPEPTATTIPTATRKTRYSVMISAPHCNLAGHGKTKTPTDGVLLQMAGCKSLAKIMLFCMVRHNRICCGEIFQQVILSSLHT